MASVIRSYVIYFKSSLGGSVHDGCWLVLDQSSYSGYTQGGRTDCDHDRDYEF